MTIGLSFFTFIVGAVVSLATSWVLVTRLERVGERLGFSEASLGMVAALAADTPEITASITAIAHARGGRRRDVHCVGKFGEALWTTGCKNDESSILGEGHFFGDVTE